MKWLLIGKNGMLGSVFARGDVALPGTVVSVDIDDLDITDESSVARTFEQVKPDAVLNCSAYTNVDGAQTERDAAYAVNVQGVAHLADHCAAHNVFLIHYSTDFIFDGTKGEPYIETDEANPLNYYGLTKWQGEEQIRKILPEDRHLIIRTSWLFGPRGKNFVKRIIELSDQKPQLSVVTDQIGCPTYTYDLAQATGNLIDHSASGVFHVCNAQWCSWYDFARFALDTVGKTSYHIEKITADSLNLPAQRPEFSPMSTAKYQTLCATPMRPWRDAVHEYITQWIV